MKCGEQIFVDQTTNRVSDQQLLSNVSRLYNNSPIVTTPSDEHSSGCLHEHSRTECHVRFHLSSSASTLVSPSQDLTFEEQRIILDLLLRPMIVTKLRQQHGVFGTVEIWKGLRVRLPKLGTESKHHVRAFPKFDKHGSYNDWVVVKDDGEGEDSYWPSKVVLIYRFDSKDYCMCWCSQSRKEEDRKYESCISARWRMDFGTNGLPILSCVEMKDVVQTMYVYEHFHEREVPFPEVSVSIAKQRAIYVVDEVYERQTWSNLYLSQQ